MATELVREVNSGNPHIWAEINQDPDPYNSFCTNGKLANYWLLLGCSVPSDLDAALVEAREKYWIEQNPGDLPKKALDWFNEIEDSLTIDLELRDQVGLRRDIYWLEQNITVLTNAQINNIGVSDVLDKTKGLKVIADNIQISSTLGRGTLLTEVIETTPKYKKQTDNIVRKWIYSAATNAGVVPAEVVYTGLEISKEESDRESILCLPISAGCPAKCRMCDIGNYFIGGLTAEQMVTMALRTVRGYSLPRLHPENLKIEWLGSGDPAFNMTEFSKAVLAMYKYYPKSKQIISSVGVSESSLNKIVDLCKMVPTSSLQISLLSLDNDVRKQLIGLGKILSPELVLEKLKIYREKTGKIPYVSLMLFDNFDEDILNHLLKLGIKPGEIHITLDRPLAVRDETLQVSSKDKYALTQKRLLQAGFDSHIYQASELEFENLGGCGILAPSTKEVLHNLSAKIIPFFVEI